MSVQPIKPSEVQAKKDCKIPDQVIEAFNELIVASFNGKFSLIYQFNIVDRIIEKLSTEEKPFSKNEIFDKHWLDVESVFEKVGWKVTYDKPGFNESYEASFKFHIVNKSEQ